MRRVRPHVRLWLAPVLGLTLILGVVPTGSAVSPPTTAPAAPHTEALGASLLNPSMTLQLRLTSLPKGKRVVRVEARTRQRGKSRYVAQVNVNKSGTARVQYLALNTKGRARKIGKAVTLFRGLKPANSYTLQTSTRTEGNGVVLATRIWPTSGAAPGAWARRTDRHSGRLANPGSSRVTTKAAKKARALVSGVQVTDGTAVAPPSGSSGTPAPPAPPSPPPPPVFGNDGSPTRIVGSPGVPYSGPAPTPPPAQMPAVLPDSSIRIPAAPPADGSYIFVAPKGSDTAPGTSRAHPVLTLSRAASLVRQGGFIVLLAGTYQAATNSVFITKPGVTVTADTGATVTLDGTAALDPASRSDQGGLATFPYTQIRADLGEGHDLMLLPGAVENGGLTPLARDRGWACVAWDGQSYSAHGTPTAGNPSGCAAGQQPRVITGYYPDQVWSEGRKLIQVGERSKVRPGRFFVDRSYSTDRVVRQTRLYLDAVDAVDVRVSRPVGASDSRGAASLLEAKASDVRINGIRVHGFAGPWWTYPVHVYGAQSGFSVTNMLVTDNSGIAIKATGLQTPGGSGLGRKVTVRDVRIHRPGWASVVVDYVTGLTIDGVESVKGNADGERAEVSQIRIVKTHNTRLVSSVVRDSIGYGVWFDQSCYEAAIVGNRIQGNSQAQLFYEFSHAGTIVGNIMIGNSTDPTLRLSGSSQTRIVNNTILGGTDPIWIYTDPRAKFIRDPASGAPRSCADHPVRYGQGDPGAALRDCNVSTVTDYDFARPGAFAPSGQANQTPGMNWRVSITMMVNNILGPATRRSRCGLPGDPPVVLCIGAYTDFAGIVNEIPLNEILPANALIDGNVYQSPGSMVHAWGGPSRPGSFAIGDIAILQAALSGPYYRLTAPERHAQLGTGWTDMSGVPTGRTTSIHAWASPIPRDTRVNAHIPAGARHYGAFLG